VRELTSINPPFGIYLAMLSRLPRDLTKRGLGHDAENLEEDLQECMSYTFTLRHGTLTSAAAIVVSSAFVS
jgi:hypothetical protein